MVEDCIFLRCGEVGFCERLVLGYIEEGWLNGKTAQQQAYQIVTIVDQVSVDRHLFALDGCIFSALPCCYYYICKST